MEFGKSGNGGPKKQKILHLLIQEEQKGILPGVKKSLGNQGPKARRGEI